VNDSVITGSGIDLIEIRRIQHAVDRYARGVFLDRVYLAWRRKPIACASANSAESFAARFAAKEAAAKRSHRHQLRRQLA